MFRSALQERDAVPGRVYTFRLKLYNELRLLQAASLILSLSACGNSENTAGKTIIPFNVHNGSPFSRTIHTIEHLEPDAVVIEDGFTVNERDVPDTAQDVADWLDRLGY